MVHRSKVQGNDCIVHHTHTYLICLSHVAEKDSSHALDGTLLQFVHTTFVISHIPIGM